MRLRQFLKNSVKAARINFLLASIVPVLIACGCTSSTSPTFQRADVAESIQDIFRKEYNSFVIANLVGHTLWIYLPLEDITTEAQKPEKYTERYSIEEAQAYSQDGLKIEYAIKPVTEKERQQQSQYDKKAVDKINNIWKIIRRVLFSMHQSSENTPQFIRVVLADIKNGFEIVETIYYRDLKKVSYGFISWDEYHHRAIQDTVISPLAILGDKEGKHLDYKDISLEEFVLEQIKYRIRLKFQKPEVEKKADIDKEIIRIAAYTLDTYGFKNFSSVEFNNLITQNKVLLNESALLNKPKE